MSGQRYEQLRDAGFAAAQQGRLEEARAFCHQALEAAKEAVNQALSGEHADNLASEGDRFGELFASEDAREGLTAFAEKREPKFAGR